MSAHNVAFRLYLIVEGTRLLLWVAFLVWLFGTYDPATWVSGEAQIPSMLAAAYLGFPYSWIVGLAVDWDFLKVSSHIPLRIALSHFFLWFVSTSTLIWFVFRRSKRHATR